MNMTRNATAATGRKLNTHELRRNEGDCREHVYLMVGQGGIFFAPTRVQTVLGSCVSVTMHCPARRWGAIFHALLPTADRYPGLRNTGDHFRYVDSSVRSLLAEFERHGVMSSELEFKVFGGASPLGRLGDAAAGLLNVRAAMDTLGEYGLQASASSVGGYAGRKIVFLTDTGLVLQKRLGGRNNTGRMSPSRPCP